MEQFISIRAYCEKHNISIQLVKEIVKRVPGSYKTEYKNFIIAGPNCENVLSPNTFEQIIIPTTKYRILLFNAPPETSEINNCSCGETHEISDTMIWGKLLERGLCEDDSEKWRGQETIVIFIFNSIPEQESIIDFENVENYPLYTAGPITFFHLTAEQSINFRLHEEIKAKLKKNQEVRVSFNPITHFRVIIR